MQIKAWENLPFEDEKEFGLVGGLERRGAIERSARRGLLDGKGPWSARAEISAKALQGPEGTL